MLNSKNKFSDHALLPFFYVALVSGLSTIYGFNIGNIFSSQEHLSDFFSIAESQSDIMIGTYILGLIFGCFIAGYLTSGSGRKHIMVASTTIGTLAIMGSMVAPNFSVLLCSKFVIGFTFGLYLIAVSLYNCEVMPPNTRTLGMMMVPICTVLGGVFALLSYNSFSQSTLVVFTILALITFVFIAFTVVKLPESPRFLALSGSTDAALSVLFRLRSDRGLAARELAEINECCRGETRGVEFIIQNSTYRRMLSFLCIATFLFHVAGSFIIPYTIVDALSLSIFCKSPELCFFTFNRPLIYTTYFTLFASIIIHTWAVNRYQTRPIILASLTVGATFLGITTIVAALNETEVTRWLVTISIFVFIFFFVGAFIIYIHVICIVLMPIRAREFGVSSIFLAHGIGMLYGLQSYMPLIHSFGYEGFFGICTVVTALIIFILYKLLPEPAPVSLETMESRIMSTNTFSELATLGPLERSRNRQ